MRVGELKRQTVQGFADGLPASQAREDTSPIAQSATRLPRSGCVLWPPLRRVLRKPGLAASFVLPSRRGGRRWDVSEQRFLTREALGRLLAEIPSRTISVRSSEATRLPRSPMTLLRGDVRRSNESGENSVAPYARPARRPYFARHDRARATVPDA